MGFKNLLFIMCDVTTRFKDVQWYTIAQHDATPDKNSSSPKVIDFPYVGRMIAGSTLSQVADQSRVTLRTESRLISQKNIPSPLVCPRMACSAPRQTGYLARYAQKEPHYYITGHRLKYPSMLSVCIQFAWKFFSNRSSKITRKLCSRRALNVK